MKSAILVINAGSSSHKCKLFNADPLDVKPLWEGALDWSIEEGQVNLHAKTGEEATYDTFLPTSTENPLKVLLDTIKFPYQLTAIGHRVVHGGSMFREPVLITDAVKESIRSLIPIAPMHNPANLKGIEATQALFPDIPQFAVFDTAFHTTIPNYAAEYPIPQAWANMGIRRYGFHGISHQYCAQHAAKMLNRNVSDLNTIICHLGNGSSITAVESGRSLDTSMGFTPLEGMMMGTRSGTIDPGIILYLAKIKGISIDDITKSLCYESGLKGVSGKDGDMRHIVKGVTLEDPDCIQAIDMYIYRLACTIGHMFVALGKVDALVFTAGIGENTPLVRAEACHKLSHLGIRIDASKNLACRGDQEISVDGSPVRILVMQTQEEWAIAKACISMMTQLQPHA